MRLIHLCFQLHLPREALNVDLEAKFREANEQVYQPFFALMERNVQKHADWHFSLMISGIWLELAEKYDKGLIERLKKLVKTGRIELINEPFYHSLAFFYNKDELKKQVELYQEKLRTLFGFEGRVFAMPDLMYNDAIGQWAEKFGFAGILTGGCENLLDFRSVNHAYEAAGCEYLRLLFQNRKLIKQVKDADECLLTETERDGKKKMVLSAKKFQKKVDLECLRGNLVNLYFDAEILGQQRNKGIIGFFDVLFENWLAVNGNKFVNAKEACFAETPTMEIAVRETADLKSGSREVIDETGVDNAVVLLKDFEYSLPERLKDKVQDEFGRKLYGLGREVIASEDEQLLAEFREWTTMDLQEKVRVEDLSEWEKIFADLKVRANEIRKKQAVEISRAYTKKRDRGLDDEDSEVKINFGKKQAEGGAETIRVNVGGRTKTTNVVKAGRVIKVNDVAVTELIPVKRVIPTQIVVNEPEIVLPDSENKIKKPRRIKKIIKKFVIE